MAGAPAGRRLPRAAVGALVLVLGQLGVLGTRSLPRLAAFAAIASIGTLMIPLARFDAQGLTAGLYYLLHSTLAGAALFLRTTAHETRDCVWSPDRCAADLQNT